MAGAGWGAKVRAEQDRGPERGVGATLLPHPPVTTQAGSRQTPMKRMMLGCRIATIKPTCKERGGGGVRANRQGVMRAGCDHGTNGEGV